MIETAYPRFEDYVIMDKASQDIVKHKGGRHDFDMVSKRFTREELQEVPQELFDLRLGVLQNIALVQLKIARGSKREADFVEAVHRADAALDMEAKSTKALMRKGQALVALKEWAGASKVLVACCQEQDGRDPEVFNLLARVLEAKGKGKGKGKAKKGLPRKFENAPDLCAYCRDPACKDNACQACEEEEEEEDG